MNLPPFFPQARVCGYALLLCFALAVLPGCSLRSAEAPEKSFGRTWFIPFQSQEARTVSKEEALRALSAMNPAAQGLASWKDFSFALEQSLAHVSGRPPKQAAINYPGLQVSNETLAATLLHLQTLLPRLDAEPSLLATEFQWFRIGPDFGITGYFEPALNASRKKSAKYSYPLYKKPANLRKGRPYHTRHAIDRKGALAGKKLEIAWVDSEADAFFLHVQGSGRLNFDDGTSSHILYADKNNREYKSLGRMMKEMGLLEEGNVSMQSIRQYLADHPEQQAELFDMNPSYVFFREASSGPLGSMGRPLTPWVSVATDRSVLPHGSLAFLITPLPREDRGETPFYALVLPQDRGGAIKRNRMDIFCGAGKGAEFVAGHLDARGAVYILVKQ
jgi:Membrane-bound lytic murein transglycosylase